MRDASDIKSRPKRSDAWNQTEYSRLFRILRGKKTYKTSCMLCCHGKETSEGR